MLNNKDKKNIKAFGLRLRKLRKHAGITQSQLAYECGLELSQISRIERGIINTSISNLYRIADVLEIAPVKLIE